MIAAEACSGQMITRPGMGGAATSTKEASHDLQRERGLLGKLFGTDGVRGVANRDLTPLLALRLGRAYGIDLVDRVGGRPRVLVGRDTRISGPLLEGALTAGLASSGVDVNSVGVLPTPGVAYLVRHTGADGGVMISASHNPVEDNGIKFFGSDGYKLDDSAEARLEAAVGTMAAGGDAFPSPIGEAVGRVSPFEDVPRLYAEFLLSTVEIDLSGLKVVLDCGNGAASELAPEVFRRLGADVVPLHVDPNGVNINVACGSTHPQVAQEAVVRHGAHLGFTFDGDADRVIAIDELGRKVDGDQILAFCACHLLKQNRLPERTIAATVYSNLGLTQAIERAGGRVVTTPAGDRYVLEAMRAHGLVLGGEQSGHLIFLEHNTTGDGVLAALQVVKVMQEQALPLSALAGQMKRLPQVLDGVRVREKDGWDQNEAIQRAIAAAERELQGQGRIFVRASGTEPLIRVMGEGPDQQSVERCVAAVCQAIATALGGEPA